MCSLDTALYVLSLSFKASVRVKIGVFCRTITAINKRRTIQVQNLKLMEYIVVVGYREHKEGLQNTAKRSIAWACTVLFRNYHQLILHGTLQYIVFLNIFFFFIFF